MVMFDDEIPLIQSQKPVRADAQRNRTLLLQTAQRLFSDEGVEAVTMSAVAREAGVGKGTLYRHFGDKAALCHALLDEDMRAFQAETLQHMRISGDAAETLRWFLAAAARYVVDHSDILREVANQGGIEMVQHPAHIWWRQTIHGLLTRLQLDEDVDYLTDVLYVMLDVQTIRFQRRSQHYSLERIVAGLHRIVERFVPDDASANPAAPQ